MKVLRLEQKLELSWMVFENYNCCWVVKMFVVLQSLLVVMTFGNCDNCGVCKCLRRVALRFRIIMNVVFQEAMCDVGII